ncbi:MAG: hypothetical protein R3A13_07990 [Bdellovibrionota bacterium]
MKAIFFLLSTILLFACSFNSSQKDPLDSLIEKLSDQGPTALNADNPFIASNLLISKEMERSEEMKGFIEHRGAPAAIEVEEGMFSPLYIHFYYVDKREKYTFEKLDNLWAIKGPFEIEPSKMTKVRLATRGVESVPKFGESNSIKNKNSEVDDPVVKTLNRIEEQRKKAAKEQGWDSPSLDDPNSPSKKENELAVEKADLDGISSYQAELDRPEAELNERGDVMHNVNSEDENLEIISFWYTHDNENAGRIKRINKLLSNTLEVGTTIRIPSYLLKSKLKLRAEDISKVQESIN